MTIIVHRVSVVRFDGSGTKIVVLLHVEWTLLTRGQWSDNDAQRIVMMPCVMCAEGAGEQQKQLVCLV